MIVDDRLILDAVLVANEAIDLIIRSNGGAALHKFDLEKACLVIMLAGLFFVQLLPRWGLKKKGLIRLIGAFL